jgi:hypothetical protein
MRRGLVRWTGRARMVVLHDSQVRVVAVLTLLAALPFISGCGGGSGDEVVVQSPDRLLWAAELKHPGVVSDPQLVKKISEAATASGARVLDVTVLSLRGDRHAPVVTLQSDDPASYMKHHLLGFLKQAGFTSPHLVRFVELVDGDGKFAWSAGHVGNLGSCTSVRTWTRAALSFIPAPLACTIRPVPLTSRA